MLGIVEIDAKKRGYNWFAPFNRCKFIYDPLILTRFIFYSTDIYWSIWNIFWFFEENFIFGSKVSYFPSLMISMCVPKCRILCWIFTNSSIFEKFLSQKKKKKDFFRLVYKQKVILCCWPRNQLKGLRSHKSI